MADEKKIIEIKVELTEGVKAIGELTKKIYELNEANKALTHTEESRTKKNGEEITVLKRKKELSEDESRQLGINKTLTKEYTSQLSTMVRETRNEIKSTNEKLGYIQQLKAQVSNLTLEYERLTQAELQGDKGGQVLTQLKSKREELSMLEQAYGNYSRNVGNYSSATNQLAINLGMVMKEIPNFAISARIGIMSLTNNLPMLAEAIKAVRVEQAQLAAEGKKTQSIFSLLGKSVFGLTGLVSIGSALLFAYSDDIIRLFTNTTKADEAVQKFNKSLKDGEGVYSTSSKEIGEIETQLRLASKGFLKSDEVLSKYNESLGKTFGAASSVSGAMDLIVKYKSSYVAAMVEMASANLLFEEATRKASEALALERQGKPSFWSNLKTVANTIYESFDVTQWGLISLPNTLSKIANTSSITYQNYLNEISKLRKESFKDMESYQKEVDKIAEKYKEQPFFAALFGGGAAKGGDANNFKNSAAWKIFEAQYDAYHAMVEMIDELLSSQKLVADGITKNVDVVLEGLYKKATEVIPKTRDFIAEFNQRMQSDADADSKNWTESQRKKYQDAIYHADLELATLESKNKTTLDARLNLLEAERKAEINNAIETGRSIQEINEFYAARRNEIKREETKAQIGATVDLLGAIASLWGENTKEYKIFATAQAVMNTWLGVTNALSQTQGGIFAQIAGAGTALLTGFAAVKKIWAVKTDAPNSTSSATTPATTNTPALPPDLTSRMAQPMGTVISPTGSAAITSGAATSISTGAADSLRIMQNMPAPIVTVKDIDIAQKRVKVTDSLAKI